MAQIKLSLLSVVLGLIFGVLGAYGLMKPGPFGAMMRKFPRYTPIGYLLMMVATGWFLIYLSMENVSDFIAFKPALYLVFGLVGFGACLFVKDFLPVRGLAAIFLLLAKLMVDTARWVDSEWRLVIVTWAYVLVVGGIWFTVSPWRMRDMITWGTANEQRIRLLSAIRLGFSLIVVILGLTVFRAAEKREQPQANAARPSQPAVERVAFSL
jgi:hypothetical protein